MTRRKLREDDWHQDFRFDDNVAWLRLHAGELWWNIRRSWRPSSTSARSSGPTYPVYPLVQPFLSRVPGVASGGTYADDGFEFVDA